MCPFSEHETPAEASAPRIRRGSILVAVLAMVALLSAILLAFMEEAMAKIKYVGLFYNRDDLRVEAYSSLETTFAVLNLFAELDGGICAPAQGWSKPLDFAGIEIPEDLQVNVKIEDETGKFSLNKALKERNVDFFHAVFEVMGVPAHDADPLMGFLFDWVDPDEDKDATGGAEKDYYERLDPPCKPPDGPIQSWEELRLIRGVNELFYGEEGKPTTFHHQFTELFSLHHELPVNINTADGPVLSVLSRFAGVDLAAMQTFLRGDDGEAGTADDRYLQSRNAAIFSEGGGGYDFQVQVLKISVEVRRGDAIFLVTAMAEREGAARRREGKPPRHHNPRRRRDARNNQERTIVRGELAKALNYPFSITRLVENVKL